PTRGATAVGARPILIAYNVNLGTEDVSIARKIAHRVRERDGGLPSVKALGFELQDKRMVQISMNLTDYAVTSILGAYDKVSEIAKEFNIPVVESEIVGLVPLGALVDAAKAHLRLSNFKSSQIIENRLLELSGGERQEGDDFSKLTLAEFGARIASKEPTPGGGTAAAYAGALSSSLVAMVCRLTIGKKGNESHEARMTQILHEAQESASNLMDLANKDSSAYMKVSKAISLPKNSDEEKERRLLEIRRALKEATIVPSETMLASLKVLDLAKEVLKDGTQNAKSDAQTAVELARAAAKGSWRNVKINLEGLVDEPDFVKNMNAKLQPFLSEIT
ncbi:MAG: cyclodeaminase/cyclohydrolase family protein, partial [Nitrososphaerales archaeon]